MRSKANNLSLGEMFQKVCCSNDAKTTEEITQANWNIDHSADPKHLIVMSLRIMYFSAPEKTLLAFKSNFDSKRVAQNITLLFVPWNETALRFSYCRALPHAHTHARMHVHTQTSVCSFSFINNNFVLHNHDHFKCIIISLAAFVWCLQTTTASLG